MSCFVFFSHSWRLTSLLIIQLLLKEYTNKQEKARCPQRGVSVWSNSNEELDGEGRLDDRMLDSPAGPGQGHLLGLQKADMMQTAGPGPPVGCCHATVPPDGPYRASRCQCSRRLLWLLCAKVTKGLRAWKPQPWPLPWRKRGLLWPTIHLMLFWGDLLSP